MKQVHTLQCVMVPIIKVYLVVLGWNGFDGESNEFGFDLLYRFHFVSTTFRIEIWLPQIRSVQKILGPVLPRLPDIFSA